MNPTSHDVQAAADAHGATLVATVHDARPLAVPAVSAPSLTQIALREADFLWLTLQRLGVRTADCRDVMQDVLMVVHRKLHTYDGRAPLRAWLYGICVGEASNHRRRAWVRREQPFAPSDAVIEARADRSAETDPEGALLKRREKERFDAMLGELDPQKRAVLILYEVEDQSCEQIAAMNGIPVGTVHSRLHAARKAFRAVLARWNLRDASGERT